MKATILFYNLAANNFNSFYYYYGRRQRQSSEIKGLTIGT